MSSNDVGLRFWEAHLYIFTCRGSSREVGCLTKWWDRVGPLKKDLHVRGGRGRGGGRGSICYVLRVSEALGGSFGRVLRVGEALGGSDVQRTGGALYIILLAWVVRTIVVERRNTGVTRGTLSFMTKSFRDTTNRKVLDRDTPLVNVRDPKFLHILAGSGEARAPLELN